MIAAPGSRAQHLNKMVAGIDYDARIIKVQQEIVFYNQSADTLQSVILNDWNNSYSSKTTPLARRFSDEYIRAFHLAKEYERGSTAINAITNNDGLPVNWARPNGHPDLVEIALSEPLYPGQKITFKLNYNVKVPNDRFTKFGYDEDGNFVLKNWFLTPARYDGGFVKYSNENIDDIANAPCDYEVTFTVPAGVKLVTDLNAAKTNKGVSDEYYLTGKNRNDINLILQKKGDFEVFRTDVAEISTNLKDSRNTEIQRIVIIDRVAGFTAQNLGRYPHDKIMVTQTDYERNPVYGLNQLPAFLSPFPDSFIYEIKFLKTYLNAYLKNTLRLDPRKDNWLFDGIQMHLMMKYIEEFHPEKKMMGKLIQWRILRSHHLFDVDFNGQYSYLYLLMARKNLDQPIGDPKDTFIKFNEQIAGKYRAGLSMRYLDDYLGNEVVPKSITEFYVLNKTRQTGREDFEAIIRAGTDKETNWFFTTVVNTRELIDYKFGSVKKQGDSLAVTVKNNRKAVVPVSLYGLKKGQVVFKQWLNGFATDSTFTIDGQGADKLVLNYNNEIPEYNARNNWKSLNKTFNNKPFKFTLFQDLENPRYNQVFYVPSFTFNIYDGVSLGMRFHNKSLLDKPFIFDVEPTYSSKTGELIGSFSFVVNNNIREGGLYNIRYAVSGSTFHYAPDAAYTKFTPSVQFRFRDGDYRENKKQFLLFRQVTVNRQKSGFVQTSGQNENYSVFNARYSKFESEIIRHYNFFTDLQVSGSFGKLSGEVQYRRLFNDNRRINLRLFAGTFLYRNTSSEFFSFGLDRPTDYLFDYNLYGRSETSGLFSQQYVTGEGGFKSRLATRYANEWMTTLNGSFNIWNWIEVYGDAGLYKNKYRSPNFVYDSGIRLNLVPDYFELYFPVYSTNGFEVNDRSYSEKIRFVVTISPSTLINLFTRKWF